MEGKGIIWEKVGVTKGRGGFGGGPDTGSRSGHCGGLKPGLWRHNISMDINRFTEKLQEAIRAAQTKAVRYGHQQIDVEHLLAALLEQEGGLAPSILLKAGIDVEGARPPPRSRNSTACPRSPAPPAAPTRSTSRRA